MPRRGALFRAHRPGAWESAIAAESRQVPQRRRPENGQIQESYTLVAKECIFDDDGSRYDINAYEFSLLSMSYSSSYWLYYLYADSIS